LISSGNTATEITNDVEVIDLDSSETNCGKLKMFPSFISGPIGGLDLERRPLICGGYDFFDETNKNCFFYHEGDWKRSGSLVESRSYSASVQSPFENEKLGLFVTGGVVDDEARRTSEVHTLNGWESILPHLPVSVSHHCMVQVLKKYLPLFTLFSME